MTTLKRQALTLTMANAAARGLGFLLRLVMARLMSAEALGVMEMAGTVTMLAATPVTAGLPTAMSRLTSKRPGKAREDVLRAGLTLVRRMSLALSPAVLLLSPALGWLLGDMRTIPAIAVSAPAVLVMGVCGVYSGYCIGRQDMRLPAVTECAEQVLRCACCFALLALFAGRTAALDAALPGIAGLLAELMAVFLFYRALPMDQPQRATDPALMRELLSLSVPMMLARLSASALRMLSAVLLPACLRFSGLTASAATAQYGLLYGMAMPLMLLPGVVTGALCTVATPAVSRLEGGAGLKRLVRRLYLAATAIGAISAAGLYIGAPLIGQTLYKQPALTPVLRFLAPLALLASVRQVQYGVIAGLGLQRRALTGTLASSAATLLITAWLAPDPHLRLFGAGIALMLGQLIAVLWSAVILRSTGASAVQKIQNLPAAPRIHKPQAGVKKQ